MKVSWFQTNAARPQKRLQTTPKEPKVNEKFISKNSIKLTHFNKNKQDTCCYITENKKNFLTEQIKDQRKN